MSAEEETQQTQQPQQQQVEVAPPEAPPSVELTLEAARVRISELEREREELLDELARLRRRTTQLRLTDLEQEKIELLDELARLRRKVLDLEEENDLLAVANERLRGQGLGLAQHNVTSTATSSSITTEPETPARHRVGIFGVEEDMGYLDGGDESFPTTQVVLVSKVCGGLNPICVRLLRAPASQPGHEAPALLAVCGGVDKFLGIYRVDPHTGSADRIGEVGGFEGAILSADVDPAPMDNTGPRVLVTCMDGSHAVVSLGNEAIGAEPAILHTAKGHQKYAVIGRWSPDGSMYATGAHDKSVKLYDRGGNLLKDFYFSGNVEALTFCRGPEQTPPPQGPVAAAATVDITGANGRAGWVWWLIVASRGVPYLTYINCVSFDKRNVSVNAADWDEHVSFAILSLAVSPDQRYLLAATDKSRLIIFRIGSNMCVRALFGHTSDDFSNPRVAWDRSGKYVFCSSQEGHKVVGWCVASERPVCQLSGHEAAVRDVTYDPVSGLLATVGFDKTLRIWARV